MRKGEVTALQVRQPLNMADRAGCWSEDPLTVQRTWGYWAGPESVQEKRSGDAGIEARGWRQGYNTGPRSIQEKELKTSTAVPQLKQGLKACAWAWFALLGPWAERVREYPKWGCSGKDYWGVLRALRSFQECLGKKKIHLYECDSFLL